MQGTSTLPGHTQDQQARDVENSSDNHAVLLKLPSTNQNVVQITLVGIPAIHF